MKDLFQPLVDRVINAEAYKKAEEQSLIQSAAEALCRKIATNLEVILDEGETDIARIYGEVGMYGVPPYLHDAVRTTVLNMVPRCISLTDGDAAFPDSIIYRWRIDEDGLKELIQEQKEEDESYF